MSSSRLAASLQLDRSVPFSWHRWRRGLLWLALGSIAAAYLIALWCARQAHPGAEHLLEALIRLVRWELPWYAGCLGALWVLYLLIPLARTLRAKRTPR